MAPLTLLRAGTPLLAHPPTARGGGRTAACTCTVSAAWQPEGERGSATAAAAARGAGALAAAAVLLSASAGPAEALSGVARIAKGATPPNGAVLFVIAREAGAPRSTPPAAVRRLPKFEVDESRGIEIRRILTFPLEFEVNADDLLFTDTFPDKVDLTLRLDSDGDAISRDDTDLEAALFGVSAKAGALELELSPPAVLDSGL